MSMRQTLSPEAQHRPCLGGGLVPARIPAPMTPIPARNPHPPEGTAGLRRIRWFFLRRPSRRRSRWRRACCADPTAFSPSSPVRPLREPAGTREGQGRQGRQRPGDPQIEPIVPTDTSLLVRGGRTGRGLARLRLLDTYTRALLAAAEQLSWSAVLTGFFEPQPVDLEPVLPPGRYPTRPQSPARESPWRPGEGRGWEVAAGEGWDARALSPTPPPPPAPTPLPVW